jgi:predicted esterase
MKNSVQAFCGKCGIGETDGFGVPENLEPLVSPGDGRADWEEKRAAIRERWLGALGYAAESRTAGLPEKTAEFSRPGCRGAAYRLPTTGGASAQVFLLEPTGGSGEQAPGAIVPFYTPKWAAGYDLAANSPVTERLHLQFGYHLVQQGYKVACVEAFPYNTVEGAENYAGMEAWEEAARRLLAKNPDWTGAGRLVSDTVRAVDFLLAQDGVDSERIVAIGHSLGGKMAFMAAAYDERIKAAICSDFGIGWNFTNWNAPWYYGGKISTPGFLLGNHHLLGLIAPRPFLLIGGEADRPESRQFLWEASKVYDLLGHTDRVGFIHHAAGHDPTPDSIKDAYGWLAEQFRLPAHPWHFIEPGHAQT